MVTRFGCSQMSRCGRLSLTVTNIPVTCRDKLQLLDRARGVEHCAPSLALEPESLNEEIIEVKLASCLAVTLGHQSC